MSELNTDILIYGGTSSAIIAAVQAKRLGKSVIIVCPETRLGGLSSGGLGFTDSGNTSAIGGLSLEFYQRLYSYYGDESNWFWEKSTDFCNVGQGTTAIDHEWKAAWSFEPKAAKQIFENFINDHQITVCRDEWLDRENGVETADGQIKSITMHSGNRYEAQVFIDASYEGDLMAAAGVSYHIGREANSVYNEKWNGVQTGVLHHKHWFSHDVSPYQENEKLFPYVSSEDPGEYGEGDNKIQAYCFRMCMTNHSYNRIPFPKPDAYDPEKYALFLEAWKDRDDFFEKFDMIPNCKTDTNNHGPFSSDYIGKNWNYPDASHEERQAIIADHKRYQMGLLYFAQNDPRVPAYIHEGMQDWGLPRDEYTETDNWSPQLYIREARRMVGEQVMTEAEVMSEREVTKSIGMGSYALDSHNIQRYITADGFVQNEGDIGIHAPKAYGISYDCLVPKKDEIQNLLVPVCMSSSHIAFGSIRMEPVFMVLGHSAATAASLAIDNNQAVQDVDYDILRELLLKDGQVLSL
ncbi:MAG: FAD-dependent oxidoreductase [Lentisphaeria bacterium]|nr:FAD-dependent oxidoreductase [Lentisphaeria bacterium]NQZ70886.1 FAD-dependent oxidoreductase [Lentisphaeria bacterium]